ncbi:MAG: hypothetical protein NTW03_19890 [Verrucomicrobia bacterium]|nr:hypothetical protein [Verrucomicrobiota bacterium]
MAGLQSKVTRVYLLADAGKTLECKEDGQGVVISLPEKAPDAIASVLCLEIKDTLPKTAQTGKK